MEYFEIDYLPEAIEFIEELDKKSREKLFERIDYAKQTKDPEVFKKLTGTNIWEFRILHRRIKYRLFAFWDNKKGAFVICTHGIIKKTDKTPSKEIDKAENIRTNYLNSKL
jgi:phage-related protein